MVASLRAGKKKLFDSMSRNHGCLKDFWSKYRSVTKVFHRVPATITNGSEYASTDISKATLLNAQFKSTFAPLSPFPVQPPVEPDGPATLDCTSGEIRMTINMTRSNVASGPDGISSRMLKGCSGSICEPLAEIFNCSLSSDKLPQDWKLSAVTPIFKAGDPTEVCNYRPISLLSVTSKLLERIVHNALLDHVLKNGYLSPKQFGFRPGSSTQEAVLAATKDWFEALERRESVACVFLDMAKAFDSLPHSLVLGSLANVGVCGSLYHWFESYLTDRRQQVALNGVLSEEILVTSGVPQGSILGPLLFLLSVNSAFDVSISRKSVLEMYADDILLYMIITCLEDVICFQSDINLLVDWIDSKDLRLNMKKTKFMLVSRKRVQQDINLTINGSPIQQVSSFTYLGVTLSQDLSWGLHIDKVCMKAKRLLGYLYRGFRLADSGCLSYLYKALVLPVLSYCSAVWNPHQCGRAAQLERVQGFAARLATRRWTEHCAVLCQVLGWCPLETRRKLQCILLCRRIITGKSIIPCSVFSRSVCARASRHVMNSVQLKTPFVRANYIKGSFLVDTTKLWNSVKGDLVDLESDLSFKRWLRSYLEIT